VQPLITTKLVLLDTDAGPLHAISQITSARRVVVLADHTKIDEDYFARFGELSDIDLLVTDSAQRRSHSATPSGGLGRSASRPAPALRK